jgi:hypothetical protein
MQVLGPICCIRGNAVEFENGKSECFNSLLLATGYRSTANMWLKVYSHVHHQSSISSCVKDTIFRSILFFLSEFFEWGG